MQYRTDPRTGSSLSVLGFGCMRLPRGLGGIDMKKSEQLIVKAVHDGINYFDTAYLYPGSEAALGKILSDNDLRGRIFLATKLPIANCRRAEDFSLFFEKQLENLKTDYIDYYLMHNISSSAQWQTLCSLGIEEWITDQKNAGRIRQAGFSFHGPLAEFTQVLNARDWDFCQIQYNYSDENYQAGVSGLKTAAEKKIPVMIMEPLLGGKLASGLPKKASEEFSKTRNDLTPAAWAFRWLWNQPEVTAVLSGMNSIGQLEDNIRTAESAQAGMLTDEENETYEKAVKIFRSSDKIPCTGCGYCIHCPQGVNIPGCFAAYNTSFAFGRITGFVQYITGTAANRSAEGTAGTCIECGRCETHCPQNIQIRDSLKVTAKRMEPFYFRWAMAFMRRRSVR